MTDSPEAKSSPDRGGGLLSGDGSLVIESPPGEGQDILALHLQDLDPALNLKMHLVNNVSAAWLPAAAAASKADVDMLQRQLTRLDGPLIISSCSSSTASG